MNKKKLFINTTALIFSIVIVVLISPFTDMIINKIILSKQEVKKETPPAKEETATSIIRGDTLDPLKNLWCDSTITIGVSEVIKLNGEYIKKENLKKGLLAELQKGRVPISIETFTMQLEEGEYVLVFEDTIRDIFTCTNYTTDSLK